MNIPESVFDAAHEKLGNCAAYLRDAVKAAIAEYERTRTVEMKQPPMTETRTAIGFFASVIKSGEPWTESCQSAMNRAHQEIDVHQMAYAAMVRRTEQAEAERDRATLALRKLDATHACVIGQRDTAIASQERAESELAEARKRADQLNKDYHDVADSLARQSNGPEHLCAIARSLRADLKTATDALTAAGYTRCDGELGWRPPTGKRPLSIGVDRYRVTHSGGNSEMEEGWTSDHKDGNGRYILFSDLLAWERSAPVAEKPAPPVTERVSPREAPHQGMRHQLKCWPRFFKAVRDGSKTFEARKADRTYAVGDTLVLCEWDPNTEAYTGAEPIERVVTYILKEDSIFGFKGHVVMAIHEAAQGGGE